MPAAPPGLPATQAVVRGVPLEQRSVVAAGVIVACAGLGVFSMWRGASALVAFGVFGAVAALILGLAFRDTLSAGNGWVASGKRFVRTDELAALDLRRHRDGAVIDMRDRDGRRLRTNLSLLRGDERVWQLVRSGVARSLEDGLAAGDEVRRAFG